MHFDKLCILFEMYIWCKNGKLCSEIMGHCRKNMGFALNSAISKKKTEGRNNLENILSLQKHVGH